MQPPPTQKRRINYKLGSIYAVVTALLLSVQEPLSFLAAKRLNLTQFVFLTQVALVMSIPLLIAHEKSRRDLVLLLGNKAHYGKFAALFLIGMAGLLLFKLGLSNAHPIIISAIINLQPFFAALGRVDEFGSDEIFWDSSAESGMIHRSPTESEAGAHVDKDG